VPTLDLTELHAEDAAPPEEPEPELELDDESGPLPALEVDPEPAPVRERVHAPRRERIRARSKPRPRPEPRPARSPKPSAPTGAVAAVGAPDEISKRLRELARRVTAGDDFEVLEVPVDVSEGALREAYRRRMAEIPDGALDSPDLGVRVQAERVRDRIESAYAHLNDPESRRAYSLLRKEEDQDRQAGTAAERALEGERWFRKGRGHLEQKRYEQAAEAFGMASHLDPGEGEYLSHLGYALFLSKPGNKVVQREAMEHVANGIKRSPTREISYIYLGRILKARGDEDAALKLFRRALRVRPDSHPALQEIRLLEMRKRKSKGILSRILGG
jgi:tetratricopeptide (TPR) repeat protein